MRPRDDQLLEICLEQLRPQFGPKQMMSMNVENIFGEPKHNPYFVHRVSSLGRKYNNPILFSNSLEETRNYVVQHATDILTLFKPTDEKYKEFFFVEEGELEVMVYEPEKYSLALTILYRLLAARSLEETPSLLLQLFLDSHLHIVNFICCKNGELTDDVLESCLDIKYYSKLPQSGVCFGDLPDARNFVDFIFYGHKVKSKTDEAFTTVSHCIFCKTNNQKCSNRNLITILVKKFKIYPFLRAYVRMILCVGLLGNYNINNITRLPYTQRYFIYQLTDYRECADDIFDQWILDNIRLSEIILREYQNRCVESTYVFDQLLFSICDENQWGYTKKSAFNQCNTVRRLFNLSCKDPNALLKIIDDFLRVEHDKDLKNTIPKPFNQKESLCSMIISDQSAPLDDLRMEEMVLLDRKEKWPPCDQNILTITSLPGHGEECYINIQKIRYHMYTYKPNLMKVISKFLCPVCSSRMKEYLNFLNKWILTTPIFLGKDIFLKNLMAARRRTNTPEWEVMKKNQLASFYCTKEMHWISPSVNSAKDNVPVHLCGMVDAVYNPWTNKLHCNKEFNHNEAEVKAVYMYGCIISMGEKKWTLCVHCGIIIPFDSYVMNTEGPTCRRHFYCKPLKNQPSIHESVKTPLELYRELYPIEEGHLEEFYSQPLEDIEMEYVEEIKSPKKKKKKKEDTTSQSSKHVSQNRSANLPEIFNELLDEYQQINTPESATITTETISSNTSTNYENDNNTPQCMNCNVFRKPTARKPFVSVVVKNDNNKVFDIYLCPKDYIRIKKFLNLEKFDDTIVNINDLKRKLASESTFRQSRRQKIPKKFM